MTSAMSLLPDLKSPLLIATRLPAEERTYNLRGPKIDGTDQAGQPARGNERERTNMPLPADTDVSTPKFLRDKYAIVGVGETTYTRGSGKTTRASSTAIP